MVCLRIICLSLALAMVTCENTLVTFQKENYIVKGGCPSKDPDVIKWRKFCDILHKNSTVCVTELFGRTTLTVPRFSNVCDALCHGPMSPKMTTCPEKKGQVGKPFAGTHQTSTEAPGTKKLLMSFKNSVYVATGGCPSKDPITNRFYSLCLSSFGHRAVCRSDRLPGTVLTYPVYANICSALCHTKKLSRSLNFCPGNARVIGNSPV